METDPQVNAVRAAIAPHFSRETTNRRCPMRAHYGDDAVRRDLMKNPLAFIACEHPERQFTVKTMFDCERCAACRIAVAAWAHKNPNAVTHQSDLYAKEHFGGRKLVHASEVAIYWAEQTGDPALASFVKTLIAVPETPAAVA